MVKFIILFFTTSIIVLNIGCCNNSKNNGSLFKKNEEFDTFFSKFDNDSTFQIKRITFPLKVYSYEYDSEIENKYSLDYIEIEKWSFEKNYYLNSEMKFNHYITINKINEGQMNVLLRRKETGIYITYTFSLLNGHWYLTKISDEST